MKLIWTDEHDNLICLITNTWFCKEGTSTFRGVLKSFKICLPLDIVNMAIGHLGLLTYELITQGQRVHI